MQLATYKFSVEDYHRMGETGILPPDKNFELIRGEIIEMSPVGFKHAAAVKRLNAFCCNNFPAVVSVQDPILLGDVSEPEPDIILLKPEDTFYGSRLPVAADAMLIIEVSDSTLRYDQTAKLTLYAENQIPEVWIANIQDQQLEVYRESDGSNYLQTLILKDLETITPLAFPEIEISVKDILG
ncbi:Uma2 family endonuclease [[Limnothrix rosea] IAM M-220]|uniref:Uma2 family endonuclease n=1 Tax=[Limnothrix rosea] IAM M-220 TaxID=454133 RepID=UPI00095BD827|nr:Uma2 family endonuclease [[Limnothrix rosea] IAM M-220]OKH17453.1 hypothetical protein NIES208_09510 [[Limnothrix rosea] IAM M-220]